MKPKQNSKGDNTKSIKRDQCQTPPYALGPLLPYLNPDWLIWEPACGEGNIVNTLQSHGFSVIGSDILDGTNFLTRTETCDAIITNPPYSNPTKFQFIARCYELGNPFALLLPVEVLGAKTAQRLFERYGVELLLFDKRINFYMPNTGYDNGGAQFPTFWCCWKILPEPIIFGKIIK